MTKSIGIIELYQHHEVLAHYCRLLLLSEDQIYAFCTEKIFDLLPNELRSSRINWILKPDTSSTPTFIVEHKSKFKTLDRLVICTVFSDFRSYLSLSKWTKTILVLHNAQTWFSALSNVRLRRNKRLTDILRLGKFLLERQHYSRQKLLKSVFRIALPNHKVLQYVKKHYSKSVSSKLITLPFGAYETTIEKHSESKLTYIHIVIPGTVSEEIRDYQSVINAFKNILKKLDIPIKLTLLGQANNSFGQSIIAQFQKLESTYFSLVYYQDYIHQNEYDKQLKHANYLLLPLKELAQFHIFKERTCQTKISGSINDMIRFGKPAITSKYVSVDEKIDKQLISYNDQKDLENILSSLSKNTLNKIDNTSFEHYQLMHLFEEFKRQISL